MKDERVVDGESYDREGDEVIMCKMK